MPLPFTIVVAKWVFPGPLLHVRVQILVEGIEVGVEVHQEVVCVSLLDALVHFRQRLVLLLLCLRLLDFCTLLEPLCVLDWHCAHDCRLPGTILATVSVVWRLKSWYCLHLPLEWLYALAGLGKHGLVLSHLAFGVSNLVGQVVLHLPLDICLVVAPHQHYLRGDEAVYQGEPLCDDTQHRTSRWEEEAQHRGYCAKDFT